MRKTELITNSFDAVIIIGNGFDLNLGLKTSYSVIFIHILVV